MKKESFGAIAVAVTGISLATALLLGHRVGELSFTGLMAGTVLLCIAVLTLPRLEEFDLKNLRIKLQELKDIKAEIDQMYGEIKHLRREPIEIDRGKAEALGLQGDGGLVASGAMRYVSGCMTRERE